jgi:hypothetical protein
MAIWVRVRTLAKYLVYRTRITFSMSGIYTSTIWRYVRPIVKDAITKALANRFPARLKDAVQRVAKHQNLVRQSALLTRTKSNWETLEKWRKE